MKKNLSLMNEMHKATEQEKKNIVVELLKATKTKNLAGAAKKPKAPPVRPAGASGLRAGGAGGKEGGGGEGGRENKFWGSAA